MFQELEKYYFSKKDFNNANAVVCSVLYKVFKTNSNIYNLITSKTVNRKKRGVYIEFKLQDIICSKELAEEFQN